MEVIFKDGTHASNYVSMSKDLLLTEYGIKKKADVTNPWAIGRNKGKFHLDILNGSTFSYRTDQSPNQRYQWFPMNNVNDNEATIFASGHGPSRFLRLKQAGPTGGASAGYRSSYWKSWNAFYEEAPTTPSFWEIKYEVTSRSTTGNCIYFMLEYGVPAGSTGSYESIRLTDSVGTHTHQFSNDLVTALSLRLNYKNAGTEDTGVSEIVFKNVELTEIREEYYTG
jgi:hypothetical protein